jgi:hypothetical protein
MKKLNLTKNQFALVDDADYPELSKYKWTFNNGYASRFSTGEGKDRKIIYMHRLLVNPPTGLEVDHINWNRLDNRRRNLRAVTRTENMLNKPCYKKRADQTYKYITFNQRVQAWHAQLGKVKIGTFHDERHAAMAHDMWAKSLYGKDSVLNFG